MGLGTKKCSSGVEMGSLMFWRFCLVLVLMGGVGFSEERIITGAGATFPYPLYQKWFKHYQRESGIRVQYRPVGSGQGIALFLRGQLDFGASDVPLTPHEMDAAVGGATIHIPTCLGAVALVYNLDSREPLRLTPELIARLFQGQITRWNDPQLVSINPHLSPMDLAITIVHRSDRSGTTNVFTEYLAKEQPTWEQEVGVGKKVMWPVGIGVEGNSAIADFIQRIRGSLGYVELTHARNQDLGAAWIQNHAKRFVSPRGEALVAAARGLAWDPSSEPLAPDVGAYPISSFTYLMIYREQAYLDRSLEQAQALSDLLHWILMQGQTDVETMSYIPLPEFLLKTARERISSMTFQGRPLNPLQGDHP